MIGLLLSQRSVISVYFALLIWKRAPQLGPHTLLLISCAHGRECLPLNDQNLNLWVHPVPINPIFHYGLCFLIAPKLPNCSLAEVVPAKQFTSKTAIKGEKQRFTAGLYGFCHSGDFFWGNVFRKWPPPILTTSKDKKQNPVRFSKCTDHTTHSKVSSSISDSTLIKTHWELSIH